MRGARAKALRRQAAARSIGRADRWGVKRVVKRFRDAVTGAVSEVNRDTRVYDPRSGRAIYRRLKTAWKRRAA